MATLAALTQRVRENLYSQYPAEHPFVQVLGAGYTDVATTIAVPDGTDWASGDILENLETGEQALVTAVATNDLTVSRGFNGTTAAAGTTGDVVAKNPKVSIKQIQDTLTAIVLDLESHGLHGFATQTFVYDPNTYLYNLDLTTISTPPGVIAVYREDSSTLLDEPLAYSTKERLSADLAATTTGIRLIDAGGANSGDTIYVLSGVRYEAVTDIPTKLDEVVVLGSTARLIGKMISPALQDPGHMTNRTVPPGQASRDARWYQAEYILAVRRHAAVQAVEVGRIRSSLGNPRTNRAGRWRS